MALKPLNSVGGFSVGEIPANVIASNAYITSNGALFSGNLAISNANANWGILTDNLYYSNGIPWDFQLPGGSNTQIQFNNNGEFGGSANFTFDTATNLLTVTGNANITGTLNAGSINTSGIANGTSNLSIPAVNGNVNISSAGNANILVVTGTGVNVSGTLHSTGNLTALNASLGNLATANYVNVSNNLNVSLELAGNTANFSGNIVALNANLGNLATANNIFATTLIRAPQLESNIANGTTPFIVSSQTLVANLNADLLDGYNTDTANTANTVAVRDVNGNLSANYFIGNGAFLTGIDTSLISNGNSNVRVSANGNVTVSVAGNANVVTFTGTGAVINGNLEVNLELQANTANFDGNVVMDNWLTVSNTANVGNLRTDNLLYANGQPWDLQEAAGSNTQIQYNINNNFAASANFTYNDATQQFTVSGNGQFNNANLGNLAQANFVNVASNIITGNLNVNLALAGNTANFSGNVVVPNLTVNNTLSGNVGNFTTGVNTPNINSGTGNLTLTSNGFSTVYDNTGNVTFSTNATVTAKTFVGNLQGNLTISAPNTTVIFSDAGLGTGSNAFTFNKTTNLVSITGNLESQNADLGNLATANYVNVSQQINGNVANFSGNIAALNANLGNLATANYVNVSQQINGNVANFSGNVEVNNLDVNLELSGNTANFSGNVVVPNLTVNLELAGNTANFSGNIIAANANLGNLVKANFIDVTSNITTSNLAVNLALAGNTATFIGNVVLSGTNVTVNNHLSGNTANFSGNIAALNANLGNIADANFVRTSEIYNGNSNVRIAPNGNVTVSATGTANVLVVSNLGANVIGYVTANGDGTFGAVKSNSVTAQGGNLTLYAGTGDNYIELRPTGNGQVDVANRRIESLATPVASTDAATKGYVDAAVEGLHIHAPCAAATPNTLAVITGGTITYNNGTAGVGATLTVAGGTFGTIDNVNIATVGTRILVKNEANAAHNGIYVYTDSTTLTRASDFDTPTEMGGGDFTFVQAGTLYNDTGWVMTDPVTTVGTSPVNFVQFSGAGTYTAGPGLSLNGTQFSVNVDDLTTEIAGSNVVVKANAQLTTPNIGAATGTSLNLTGNLLAGNVNSNALITAANINVTSNVLADNFSANSNIIANGLTVNLALSGNTANFSGNVEVNNLDVNLELAGNTANFSGNIKSLNANLGNLATANFVNVSNNLTVNLQLDGNTANFIGNVVLSGSNVTVNNHLSGNAANFSGNVVVPNLTVNLELAGNTANFSGNVVTNNLVANGVANVGNLNVVANVTSDLLPNANLTLDLGSSTQRWDNIYAGNIDASGNLTIAGNLSSNNYTANIITANTLVNIGNTQIRHGEVTTTSASPGQTISTVAVSGITGIEWIVKGIDITGSKYSIDIVTAVTNGSSVDYSVFGGVNLGTTTGSLAVNIVGSNIDLQVTPSSSNSTVWITQYRTI